MAILHIHQQSDVFFSPSTSLQRAIFIPLKRDTRAVGKLVKGHGGSDLAHLEG